MTSPSPNREITATSQRNNKIASILCLVITVFEKIEKIKEKLCGFSPKQFSPESIFEALDLTEKGYLDIYDIHSFLANDKIRDRDVLLLFSRFGDSGVGRMTYLGYLSMLKPYFDHELARDLLLRDTVAHGKERSTINNQESIQEMQQTVLILLNELFLLHCICIQEHEELKAALIEEYMLNQEELRQILGFGGRVPALTAIFEFICCSCEFQIEKSEVKYLLSFLQTNQPSLGQQKHINLLFIPSRPFSKKVKLQQGKEQDAVLLKNREELHSNYTKNYLGRSDLITTTNKLSFLNYIHPNSYNIPIQQSGYHKKPVKQQKYSTESSDVINAEHKRLKLSQEKIINRAHKQVKPRSIIPEQSQMSESIVEKSNLIHRKHHQDSRLNQPSFQRLQTPILEQFMHDSNLKKNMGYYRSSQQGLQLKQVLEQSNLSSSDAMVRVEHTSKQAFRPRVPQSNQYNYKQDSRNESIQHSKHINNSFLQGSKYNQAQKPSEQGRPDSTSGFLGQFIRSQFR